MANNRDYKNFARGGIYHIYNRGNNKEIVFRDDQDKRNFLFRLGLAINIPHHVLNESEITRSPKSRIRILGLPNNSFKLHSFCLMDNHFHLLLEQCSEVKISTLMHRVSTSFAKYLNLKYQRVGQVFQDQFKAVQVDSNPQLMLVSSYIHMNPVKDGLVKNIKQFKWSSYSYFANNEECCILDKEFLLSTFGGLKNFANQTQALYRNYDRELIDLMINGKDAL